jgi:hypothetical protein
MHRNIPIPIPDNTAKEAFIGIVFEIDERYSIATEIPKAISAARIFFGSVVNLPS